MKFFIFRFVVFIFLQFEAKVVLAKLIQSFEMKPLPDAKVEIEETGTLRPKGGVPVTLNLKQDRSTSF